MDVAEIVSSVVSGLMREATRQARRKRTPTQEAVMVREEQQEYTRSR